MSRRQRRFVTRSSRDPVTSYARRVDSGAIVAGRLVRLQCARHLADLDRQGSKGFPYFFDAQRAQDCFDFFVEFLTLDGSDSPFELLPWMKFIFGSIEGWVDADYSQRFSTAYIETSKGTGKTPAAGGYGVFCLCGKGERNAEIYSLGVTGDQAQYLFRFAKRMIERSEDLSSVLDCGERNIAWISRGSFMRPLAAEGKSLDNKRPYLALVDELHEHPSDVIPSKMRLGFKGRKNALLFEITNAGHDQTSVCWDHHEYTSKVLEGQITGDAADRWFGYVCQLDVCEGCRAKGLTQPADGCGSCDHWTDPRVWLKVQPSLGVTITEKQLQALVNEALDRPSEQARVKRLNFCMWTQAHTVWITSDKWDACRVEKVAEENDGVACAAGVDMSEKLDLTAACMALRVDDDERVPEETVVIEDMEGEQRVRRELKINFSVELVPFFWIPEDTLISRVKDESIPFDRWRADGHIYATKGPVIDYDVIYETLMEQVIPKYRPQRIGYDPHNATQFALALRDLGRQNVVEVAQGRALSESFKLFEALVLLRRIRYRINPVLSWCVSNASPKRDRYENLWLEKPSKVKRIDGVIAAVIALSQLMLLPKRRRRRGQARIWTPDGFKDAAGTTEDRK